METGVRNDTDRHRQSGKLIAFRRSWKTGWVCTLLVAGAGELEVRVKVGSGVGSVYDTLQSYFHALLLRCPDLQEQLLSRTKA